MRHLLYLFRFFVISYSYCYRVDSMMALQILAEAAKTNISAMRILHSLARGSRPKIKGGSPPDTSRSDDSGKEGITLRSKKVIS